MYNRNIMFYCIEHYFEQTIQQCKVELAIHIIYLSDISKYFSKSFTGLNFGHFKRIILRRLYIFIGYNVSINNKVIFMCSSRCKYNIKN